jgi:hypothetical protein
MSTFTTNHESPKNIENIKKNNQNEEEEIVFDYYNENKNSVSYNISVTLMQLISENMQKDNYKEKLNKQKKQIFTSKIIPKISVSDYLLRITKYANVSDEILIIALIYLDKLCKKNKIMLNSYNVHRLLFISILISIKMNSDKIYKNIYYSKISGINPKELCLMEYEFMHLSGFMLNIKKEIYEKYKSFLIKNLY